MAARGVAGLSRAAKGNRRLVYTTRCSVADTEVTQMTDRTIKFRCGQNPTELPLAYHNCTNMASPLEKAKKVLKNAVPRLQKGLSKGGGGDQGVCVHCSTLKSRVCRIIRVIKATHFALKCHS